MHCIILDTQEYWLDCTDGIIHRGSWWVMRHDSMTGLGLEVCICARQLQCARLFIGTSTSMSRVPFLFVFLMLSLCGVGL